MSRGIATVLLATTFATTAEAHFIFLLPPTEGRTVTVIFADTPKKDEKVEIGKIEFKGVQVLSASGKATSANVVPETGGWRVEVPDDTSEVRTTVEYGVVNRGEGNVIRLRHHARLYLGDNADEKPAAAFDIAAVKGPSGTAFKVTFDGKPVPGADVTVHEPGTDLLKVLKTDPDGVTPAFTKPGRYSARAMNIDKTPGEFEGRKYAITHSYATATVVLK